MSSSFDFSKLAGDEFEICVAIKAMPSIFKFLKPHAQTNNVCLFAITMDSNNFKYLTIDQLTMDMCKRIINIDSELFKYMPNQTEELCKFAITKDPRLIKYVKNYSMDICKFALDCDINSYDYIDFIKFFEQIVAQNKHIKISSIGYRNIGTIYQQKMDEIKKIIKNYAVDIIIQKYINENDINVLNIINFDVKLNELKDSNFIGNNLNDLINSVNQLFLQFKNKSKIIDKISKDTNEFNEINDLQINEIEYKNTDIYDISKIQLLNFF